MLDTRFFHHEIFGKGVNRRAVLRILDHYSLVFDGSGSCGYRVGAWRNEKTCWRCVVKSVDL